MMLSNRKNDNLSGRLLRLTSFFGTQIEPSTEGHGTKYQTYRCGVQAGRVPPFYCT